MSFDFDHCYNKILDPKLFDQLKERGFWGRDEAVNHPGSLTCRFLAFPLRKEFNGRSLGSYLEFCAVADINALRQKVLNETGKSVSDESFLLRPGLSLRYAGKLEELFERLRNELPKLDLEFEHRNYDWQANATERRLGWNFLRFKEDPIPGMYLWVTEYERSPNQPLPQFPSFEVANGGLRLLGPVLDNQARAGLDLVASVLGAQVIDGKLSLHGDSAIYLLNEEESIELRKKCFSKVSPFLAILLEVESLEKFIGASAADYTFNFRGRQVAGVRLGENMWDILAIERVTS